MITWGRFIVHGIFVSEKKETQGSMEGVCGVVVVGGELKTRKE
jgi:hypothetical protein